MNIEAKPVIEHKSPEMTNKEKLPELIPKLDISGKIVSNVISPQFAQTDKESLRQNQINLLSQSKRKLKGLSSCSSSSDISNKNRQIKKPIPRPEKGVSGRAKQNSIGNIIFARNPIIKSEVKVVRSPIKLSKDKDKIKYSSSSESDRIKNKIKIKADEIKALNEKKIESKPEILKKKEKITTKSSSSESSKEKNKNKLTKDNKKQDFARISPKIIDNNKQTDKKKSENLKFVSKISITNQQRAFKFSSSSSGSLSSSSSKEGKKARVSISSKKIENNEGANSHRSINENENLSSKFSDESSSESSSEISSENTTPRPIIFREKKKKEVPSVSSSEVSDQENDKVIVFGEAQAERFLEIVSENLKLNHISAELQSRNITSMYLYLKTLIPDKKYMIEVEFFNILKQIHEIAEKTPLREKEYWNIVFSSGLLPGNKDIDHLHLAYALSRALKYILLRKG